jgi:hypothetical protein
MQIAAAKRDETSSAGAFSAATFGRNIDAFMADRLVGTVMPDH